MRLFLLTFLAQVLLTLPVRGDVLDSVTFQRQLADTEHANRNKSAVPAKTGNPAFSIAYSGKPPSVQQWLAQADLNIRSAQLRIVGNAMLSDQSQISKDFTTQDSGVLNPSSSRTADAAGSPVLFLFPVPRTARQVIVGGPVMGGTDPDVVLGLQHHEYQTALRGPYLQRCRSELLRSLYSLQGLLPPLKGAGDANRLPDPPVAGSLDVVVAAFSQDDRNPAGLQFQDPAMSAVQRRLCFPDLSMAEQPFTTRELDRPGKPFRPVSSFSQLALRLHHVWLNLQVSANDKVREKLHGSILLAVFPESLFGGGTLFMVCGILLFGAMMMARHQHAVD